MLSIILVPMMIVQVITVFIFYERHWDTVTRHMAANLASEIAFLIDGLGKAPNAKQIDPVITNGWQFFNFPVSFERYVINLHTSSLLFYLFFLHSVPSIWAAWEKVTIIISVRNSFDQF